jgi:hypothetical protein
MRLKTGPRIVLAVLVLAGIAYGLNIYLDGRKAKVAEQPVVAAPAYDQAVQPTQSPVVQAQPEQAPAPAAPAPRPANRQDKAMADLLKETK